MYIGFRGTGLVVIMLCIGIGLVFNCLRGLFSGEGMYDRDSSNVMFWTQILGIAAGAGLVFWAVMIFRVMFML